MNMKIFRKWRSRYIPGARELLSSAANAIAKAVRKTIFVSSTTDGKKSSGIQICEQGDIIDQFNDEKCEKGIEEQEYGSIRGNKDIKVEINECEEEIEKYGINIEVCSDNICKKRFNGNEFEDKKCEKEIDGRDYEVDRCIIEKNREHQNIDKITEEIINLEKCKMKKDEKKEIDKNIKIMENDQFKLGFINIHSTRFLSMMEETTKNREKNIMIRKIFRDFLKTLYNKMENLHQINNINNNENEKTNNSQKRKRESNYENEKDQTCI